MRKFFLLVLFASFFISATPAQAHHGDIDAFFDTGSYDAAMWSDSGTENFCFSPEFQTHPSFPLSDFKFNNMRAATGHAFDHWRANTQIDRAIDPFSNPTCDWNLSFRVAFENAEQGKSGNESTREDFCEHRPLDQKSSIQWEDLSWLDSRMALTWTCDVDNNGVIDYFVMVIDPRSNWHFVHTANPGSNDWDYPSVVTHEAGHGYGFALHWADDSETCPNNSNHNTMCNDGFSDFGTNGTHDRTIESHDIGETNQAYP